MYVQDVSQRVSARRNSVWGVALGSVLVPWSGVSAWASEVDGAALPEVTVRATAPAALPRPTVVQDAVWLQTRRTATSDTASLLQDAPGVALYGAGGVSGLPVVRGLADDRVRVQVDGMDLISACGNHMNPPLSYIDPQHVGRVQLFTRIAPVSAGGDGLGAAVQVDSAPAVFAEPGQAPLVQGEVGAFYRSNGNAHGGHASATWANERLSVNYRAASAQSGNYHAAEGFKPAGLAAAGRDALDADEVGSSAYESNNQALTLGWRPDQRHQWELKLGTQTIPYQGFANQRMDMTDNDSEHVNLRYRGRYDWGQLEARVYHEHTRHAMQFGDDKLYWYGPGNGVDGVAGPLSGGANGYAAGMPMDTEGRNTGVRLKADVPLNERDLLRVGAEWQRYRLDDWWIPSGKGMWPNTFWNIRDGERDRAAWFGEWDAQWSPQWSTQLGLRHEQVRMNAGPVQGYNATFSPADETAFNTADRSRTDHLWDWVALARFEPDNTQSYEFGYSLKNRAPNLYERFAWSTHGMAMRMVNLVGDGNGYVGNLGLAPEKAHTLSFSADWHDAARQQWGVQFSPYVTYVQDYIDAARCVSTTPYGMACTSANLSAQNAFVYLRYANQSARLYGFDLSGQRQLGQWAGASWAVRGQLNWVRGQNRTTGDDLYHIMPLNAKLALERQQGRWSTTLEAELVSAKNRVNATRNETETAGYGLLHLRASYAVGQVRLDMGVENLLNRYYEHPLGGAYTGQGKTMSGTGVPWGVAVPGAGRSVYAGVNVKF